MKKGLIIVGECILFITMLVVVRVILGIFFSEIMSRDVMSFILYFISCMGSILICRLNLKKNK